MFGIPRYCICIEHKKTALRESYNALRLIATCFAKKVALLPKFFWVVDDGSILRSFSTIQPSFYIYEAQGDSPWFVNRS